MTDQRSAGDAQDPLTVAVVSPEDAVRDRFALLLAGARGVDLVDVATSDGHLAHVSVVLVDTSVLADGGGLDVNHLLGSNPCVIGLAHWDRPELSAVAVALGAADVVPVEIERTELLDVLSAVAAGRLREVASTVRRAADHRRSTGGSHGC